GAHRPRRPILAAPWAWAGLGGLAGAGLARLVVLRTAGLRVEALEDVLPHIGLTGDEVDLVLGALELPEVAAARDVDETFHLAALVGVVEHDRLRDLLP